MLCQTTGLDSTQQNTFSWSLRGGNNAFKVDLSL